MLHNIPNRIKQPAQCCPFCGKSYKKKTNLNNHIILCELYHKSSKKIAMDEDDEDDLPSQRRMYQMMLEMAKKLNGLDEKMDEINKWVIKKKKKINVIEWLNTNLKPDFVFENLSNKITIIEEDIENLFNNPFTDVLNQIFHRSIYQVSMSNLEEMKQPIFAFVQKSNIFYVYENETEGWIELTKERLVRFLEKIYMKISREFSAWKKNNKWKIDNDENFQLLCDKTSVKMYSVDIKNDATLGKIKSNMYSKMKTDIKSLVEYEFEF